MYTHIDLFLVDKWLLQQDSSSILEITWSDHATISLYVEERDASPPVRLWCCNSKVLSSPTNVKLLSQHFREYFDMNAASTEDSFFLLWNAHKAYMRGLIIQAYAQAKKQYNLRLDAVFSKI